MSSLRLTVVAVLLMSAIACGGDDPSPVTGPSPSPAPSPIPASASSSVTIPVGAEGLGNRAFAPDELNVAVGTTVTWMNTDVVSHTSTSDAPGWDSGIVGPGGRFSFSFQTAGSFPYHCAIHPGMVGRVVVR